jgi:hypothetical protein
MNHLATKQFSNQNDAPDKVYCGDHAASDRDVVQLHLHKMSQLFEALDPSPFREKDLDHRAEEYIVESVKEFRLRVPCALVIHLDEEIEISEERVIEDAIRVHFARRAEVLQRNLRDLLRRGVTSLAIGVAFLAVVFVIAQLVGRVASGNGFAMLFREGLIIVAWVAMWRPLEIFLYDWWPIVGERRLYERLSQIEVRIFHLNSTLTSRTQPAEGAVERAGDLTRE